MSEMLGPSPRGEARYYMLGGALMQRVDGLEQVRNELEGIGIPVWDGALDTARIGGGRSDGALTGEIVVMGGLEEYERSRVQKLGGSIAEIDPELSDLHRQYLRRRS